MFGPDGNKQKSRPRAEDINVQGKTEIQSEAYLEKEWSSIPREIVQ